jgi:hypothetical protein
MFVHWTDTTIVGMFFLLSVEVSVRMGFTSAIGVVGISPVIWEVTIELVGPVCLVRKGAGAG